MTGFGFANPLSSGLSADPVLSSLTAAIAGVIIPIGLLGINAYLVLGWRRQSRLERGLCEHCGYDLRGEHGGGRCPECGHACTAT